MFEKRADVQSIYLYIVKIKKIFKRRLSLNSIYFEIEGRENTCKIIFVYYKGEPFRW